MPSSHLILCRPLLLLPLIPPSIRVFSNESTLCMRWPKYWSFSLSISPSNEHPGLISFRMDWLDLLAVQGTPKSPLQQDYIWLNLIDRISKSLITVMDHWDQSVPSLAESSDSHQASLTLRMLRKRHIIHAHVKHILSFLPTPPDNKNCKLVVVFWPFHWKP